MSKIYSINECLATNSTVPHEAYSITYKLSDVCGYDVPSWYHFIDMLFMVFEVVIMFVMLFAIIQFIIYLRKLKEK